MKSYILAIDQSTSGTKVLVTNRLGEIVYQDAKNHRQIYPQAGWVEHDANEIYANVKTLLNRVVESRKFTKEDFAALAITNQRETAVVWDAQTGEPVYQAIVWQCRRTTELCQSYAAAGYGAKVEAATGLTIDPYFSASKFQWILDHVEGAREKAEAGRLLAGTIDSWLIWKLTRGKVHATDYTNASRTLLFNIHQLEWDAELLAMFHIPRSMLPEVKDSDAVYGHIEDPNVQLRGLPIAGVIGDSQGALFGQRCFAIGATKMTYGTGTSIMMHTEEYVQGESGLVTCIAWGRQGKVHYGLEGILNTTGDVIKWLIEDVELVQSVDEVEAVAASIADPEGVYLVPALVGLSAPYWSPDTRAAILGMSRNTKKAHIVRAALESIAYQVKDIMEVIRQQTGLPIRGLYADGGASKNRLLMQLQADLLGDAVQVSKVSELSAMGAVYLAGLSIGIWSSLDEVAALKRELERFSPQMPEDIRERKYAGWKQAVQQVLV